MNDDLLTQLRTYGEHVRSEMTPLEVERIGDPLVVLKPRPPKSSRRRTYALIAAGAVLLILLPILVMRQPNSIRPVATTIPSVSRPVVLLPDGGSIPVVQLTLLMPDGWSTYGNFAVLKNSSNPPNGMGVGFWSVINIYTDRCQWNGALLNPPVGPTVDDLATALAEHWGSDATAPIDVMLDGFAGKEMVLTVPTDVDFSDCDSGQFRAWTTIVGERYYQGPGQSDQLWILDVDGVRLVIVAAYFPETSPEDRAELQQIIDSIDIESS